MFAYVGEKHRKLVIQSRAPNLSGSDSPYDEGRGQGGNAP